MSGVDRKFQQLAHSQNGFNKAIDDGFDGHAKYIGIMDKINRMQSAVEVLDAMKERIALNEEESTSIDKVSTSLIREATILEMIKMNHNNVTLSSAQMFSALGKGAAQFEKGAKASARLQQISAVINAYAAINKVMADPTLLFPTNVITATAIGASAFANVAAISNQINDFEDGGLIQGRRHSAGGTLINAEDGEFVMSRNAVSAIGVENLNRMNQGQSGGGGTIVINNPIVNSDFVENDFAELMREAVRRGADFGISWWYKSKHLSTFVLVTIGDDIRISTQKITFDDEYYKPILLNIPSISESLDIEQRKYKISSVSLSISDYEEDGERFSDNLNTLMNKEVKIYYSSPSCSDFNDCHLAGTYIVRSFSQDEDKVTLNCEDLSQDKLHQDFPLNELGDDDIVHDKYKK